jgi:hypothetical protein
VSHTRIEIAGLSVGLESPLSPSQLGIEPRLGPFFSASPDGDEDIVIHWRDGEPAPSSPRSLIYDAGSIWRMYGVPSASRPYQAIIDYSLDSSNPGAQALIKANAAWDDLEFIEQAGDPGWSSLLALGAGELIVRTGLIFSRGLVFHASGIDDGGCGVLFVGQSGAGKSTQAAVWSSVAGVIVMNDDRIAVRLEDARFFCYGMPWGGTLEIAKNHQAPLDAIMLLEKGNENSIRRLSREASFPLLMARAFLPYWEVSLLERSLDILSELVARVPVYALRCRPEPDVIPLVRSVL